MEVDPDPPRQARFRLRTWLTRWGILALFLGQLAAALGVYESASHLLWTQAERRQLQTIDTCWKNRPEALGEQGRPPLHSQRAAPPAEASRFRPALFAEINRFKPRTEVGPRPGFPLWGPFFADLAGHLAECRSIRLFDPGGALIYSKGANLASGVFSREDILKCIDSKMPIQRRIRVGCLESQVALLYPVEDQGRTVGVLQGVRQVDEVRNDLNGLAFILLLCNSTGFLIGVTLLHWLAEKVCTPLERLAENTRRLGQGQFGERAHGSHSPYELWALAQAFDQAAGRLQESFESQSRFVADASHELKTPLTILSGMAEILELNSRQDEPDRKKAVRMIGEQVERMSRLVGDLLLLSTPAEEMPFEPVHLSDLLEDLVDGVTMFTGRSHDIELDCSLEARVAGPETRIQRIFRNLLDNAIQHGRPQGKILIQVVVRNGWVESMVQDDGPGIEAHDLPYICDRFYRPDLSRQRKTGGSGLGLAIVKSLVESLQGKLAVQSPPGGGTVVWVHLPSGARRRP